MKQIIVLFVAVVTCNTAFSQNSEEFKSLINKVEEIQEKATNNVSLWRGEHPKDIQITTWDDLKKQQISYEKVVKELQSLAENDLSRQDKISISILLHQIQNAVSQIKYKAVFIPFNAEGGFHTRHDFFLNRLPFRDKSDYDAYLHWLPQYEKYLKQHQDYMALGIKEKMMAPKVIVRNMQLQLKPMMSDDFNINPFAIPFLSMPHSISSADSAALIKKAMEIISKNISPAFKKLNFFVDDRYLPAAPEKVGIMHSDNGKAYYEDRINYYTTLDISPDSVFNLGISEVSRIKQEMEKIIRQIKFEGDFKDFFIFLRTDPQFYATTGQELLNYAAWLSKKAEGELPKLFSNLYDLPFTVEPVPDAIAPTYTGGRYVGGSRAQNRPGIYWVNTYNLASRTLYTIPALTLHEAVPGHHLQNVRAAKIDTVPKFRKSYYISAFGEGWGLYAEFLGEEMGMYETPYELFGRYTYEMWRACRLVVDVGMHYKDWSREKALNFMAENTALSLHEVNTEIDRYIGWPGQAVSYKVGEIVIKSLRTKAEESLGEVFNIQEFHERILRNGSVPLPVLIEEIDQYIEGK